MASSRDIAKQSPGWGNFLQQAVLSVESKLDNILADDDQPPARAVTQNGAQESTHKASTDISRSSSAARTNDRLQERLAKAMVKKGDGYDNSAATTPEPVSRTATPINHDVGERPKSVDKGHAIEVPSIAVEDLATVNDSPLGVEQKEQKASASAEDLFEQQPEIPTLSHANAPERLSVEKSARNQTHDIVVNGVRAPYEGASPEEMYTYIEKIDALQAKLQYLTKEAAEAVHDAALAAKSGSAEKKLLEKDEKIALLMEEGQNLSKTEMKHLMTIKKLRSQAAENTKSQQSVKARAEKAVADLQSAEQRANRAEAAVRRAEESLQISLGADRDLEALKSERDALTSTVAEIRTQLAQATSRADNAERKALGKALGAEKKQIAELQDDITSAKVEREISEGKLRREIKDLRASLEQEKEQSTSLRTELRAEQLLLENKMESLRNRAEEATSSGVGDTQATLLRQIETLQNQYAVARENWQGIEGSLLARIADIEKERDGLEQREGDLRKKVRELSCNAKKAEKENAASRDEVYAVEQSLSEQKSAVQRLQRKVTETEASLAETRGELEVAQEKWQSELSRRVEEEKGKRKEQIALASQNFSRNESPAGSARRSIGLGTGLEHTASSFVVGQSLSRRSSVMPSSFRSANTPSQQNASTTFQSPVIGLGPETPASQLIDQEEYFADPPTPASVGTNRGVNDLMSASTVGAGPSVQLVERMSASVRRLESEKAASRDEMARLTAQRDESRKEVVALMREVEQKRASDERIKALEEELGQVDQRHQTTLEMLGEKSELVEELRADVADVKQMYRDLVDSTMK